MIFKLTATDESSLRGLPKKIELTTLEELTTLLKATSWRA